MLVRFLFASLCYHYEHFNTYLHCEHKLHSTPLFMAAFHSNFKQYAIIKYPWNASEYTPFFTGIPLHVMMLSELEGLRLKLD